jgi:CheY-like chemotaxis protein
MTRTWGMLPTSAGSAAEALAAIQDSFDRGRPFRLIITDFHMPEIDGFGLVERLRQTMSLARPVVLMLTSGDRAGDLARCRELGVSAYLIKPVRRNELRAAIGRALNQTCEATTRATSSPEVLFDDGAGCSILVVDDQRVNQRVAQIILEKAGHKVRVADGGREALALLRQQSFDMLLLDVQMPDMDGFETTAAIRKMEAGTGRRTTVIAMTAHAMSGDRERCLDAGMDDYVSKPVQKQVLLDTVARYTPSVPASAVLIEV